MRAAFLSTLLLVAFTACAAQNAAQNTVIINSTVITLADNESKDAESTTPPVTSSTASNFTPPRIGEMLPLKTCLTMRSYLFSAATKGQAPRLVGYTTCTPSDALKMKRATQPRVKLLPQ